MSYKVVILLVLVAAVCAKNLSTPPCPCGRIYLPVCASNRVTYNNMCEFNCGKKLYYEKHGLDLTVILHGTCDGKN